MRIANLPHELVWQDDGHLSEVAIVAIADGQGILPKEALAHVDACEPCTKRLGEAALLSAHVAGALVALDPAAASRARGKATALARPLPGLAIGAGLGVAALGAAPWLAGLPSWLPRVPILFAHVLPVFARTGFLALRAVAQGSQATVGLSCASMVVLCLAGFAVSRLTPREGVVR
jgi:hypothetical protein